MPSDKQDTRTEDACQCRHRRGHFEALSRDLRLIAATDAPVLKQTTQDVRTAARDFRSVSRGLKSVVDGVSSAQLRDTLKSVKSASEDMEAVSSRLRALSEDPYLAAQAKTMLSDLQKALFGAADVVDQAGKLLAAGKPGTPRGGAQK